MLAVQGSGGKAEGPLCSGRSLNCRVSPSPALHSPLRLQGKITLYLLFASAHQAETNLCVLQPVLPLAVTPLSSALPSSPTRALALCGGF